MNKKECDNQLTEEMLRRIIRSSHSVTLNPWFTRKVMKRLPLRQRKWIGAVEISLYLIVAAALAYISWSIGWQMLNSPNITVGDLARLSVCAVSFGSVVALVVTSVVGRDAYAGSVGQFDTSVHYLHT